MNKIWISVAKNAYRHVKHSYHDVRDGGKFKLNIPNRLVGQINKVAEQQKTKNDEVKNEVNDFVSQQ